MERSGMALLGTLMLFHALRSLFRSWHSDRVDLSFRRVMWKGTAEEAAEKLNLPRKSDHLG